MELRFLRNLWRRKRVRVTIYVVLAVCLPSLIFRLLVFTIYPLPMDKLKLSSSVIVLDRNGKLLRAFTAPDGMWRFESSLEGTSPQLRMAVLEYEDRYFQYHYGINPISIIRAAITNLKARRIVCGGSTITMQVARMMEPKPRTFRNKFIETIRAIQLEMAFSKDEILRLYLNMAPYGGNIVGSGAASYFYFGKEQRELSLGEAALLAAIPNSPTSLRPDAPASLAEQGRDKVLRRLLKNGKISQDQFEEAMAEPLPERRFPLPFIAPHLARDLKSMYPGSARIVSTIDRDTQILARDTLQERIIPLRRQGVSTGAVVIMDTRTREVLALVGSADFFDSENRGQVNGATASRSPGSILKPFAYALAMDRGLISPESILSDVPVDYSGYRPVNYDDRFRGAVTAREALTHSLNVPAVNLAAQLERSYPVTSTLGGGGSLYDFLKQGGITTLTKPEEHYGLTIILGGCGVTLLDMTNLYCGLANMGGFAPYRLRLDRPARTSNSVSLLGRGTAFILTEMLAEVNRPDLPRCWEAAVNLPKVAWKTGTSYGHRDAWSIGYSPQFTVGVWIGNFNGMGSSAIVGAEAAGPVLFDLFNALSKQKSNRWYTQPPEVARRQVCALSGMVMSPNCIHSKEEYYIPGISPNQMCTIHRTFAIDKETGTRLCSHCRIGREYEMRVFEIWPPKIATWMERNGISVDRIPAHYPGCSRIATGSAPVIHSPSANCEYAIRPGIDIQYQKILLEASASNDTSTIFWFLDSELVFHGSPTKKVFITPIRGRHTLTCMDEEGRSTEMTLVVK